MNHGTTTQHEAPVSMLWRDVFMWNISLEENALNGSAYGEAQSKADLAVDLYIQSMELITATERITETSNDS